MEDDITGDGLEQRFVVTISWSSESDVRVTEGDLKEPIEAFAIDLDEDAAVDVAETLGLGGE